MDGRGSPIQRKLMTIILGTSGAVLLFATAAFFVYDWITFRQATVRSLATLGNVIATNSTAALAFADPDDASDTLEALKAETHVVAAALYDNKGTLFATYQRPGEGGQPGGNGADLPPALLPARDAGMSLRFEPGFLVGEVPVIEGQRRMGTLYLRSDLGAMTERLQLYGAIAALIIALSSLVAYLISRHLQRQISGPILSLAETAQAISSRGDYSVRAAPAEGLELGLLTEAFNHMLARIQEHISERRDAEMRLHAQVSRLSLLQHITRAVAERQDLGSIFRVVLQSLEEHLPVDVACIGLYDATTESFTVSAVGPVSRSLAEQIGLGEQQCLPISENGLYRCARGQLIHEPDVSNTQLPLTQRLVGAGLRSLVAAPLLVEGRLFAVLVVAGRDPRAFASADCEFLKQLSEHVALAAHQAQLRAALQAAYDDLRHTQHTVMQHERLRALGQMASGIAHDINNAISPVSLYTESLLEREQSLSDRGRQWLTTIQRAIEDVAGTVARMREFYREREPQIALAAVQLNRLIEQVVELTRARWSDEPQGRGVDITLRTDLAEDLPEIMGAEGEIRDALTNLIFNAVDAMPQGGTLTLRTRTLARRETDSDEGSISQVCVEVIDTGIGMDEETRRRCLEPFFTTKGERGTGLGLAMVYGMVQRHSGDIEIEGQPGVGTTVRLIFAAASKGAALAAERTMPVPVVRSHRILLIDDDPLLRSSLRDALEGDGHAVEVAEGGQAGIDAFRAALRTSAPFSLVITDLGMPHVDGRKVAQAIREAAPGQPIILLTGWGQRLVAEGDIPVHVDRVLSKPPRLSELRAALAELAVARAA